MKCVLIAAVIGGCVPTRTVGPFVRDFRVEGGALIVNRCLIEWGARFELSTCTTERRQLTPVVSLPVSLDGAQILQGISVVVREGVARCGAAHRVGGPLELALTIDPAGRVADVVPTLGGAPFTSCVRGVFGVARFAPSQRGVRVTVPSPLPIVEAP